MTPDDPEKVPGKHGLHVQILWFDADLTELRVHASNNHFAGMADLYINHDELAKLARAFRGFPASTKEQRDIELGNFNPNNGGGGLRLRLRCTDASGHVAVDVMLRTDPHHTGRSETAEFSVPVEPAAIDAFIAELDAMPLKVGATAYLRQTA